MMHQTRQTVLLRADGGPRLGLGHVLRCFALAEGLAEAGFEPVLALKPEAGSLEDLGLVTNFQVVAIPSVSTLAADALLTNKIAREYAVAYVIIDVCHLDNLNRRASLSEYLSDLRKQNLTVCFTGSDSLDFDADFVVSPYYRVLYPQVPDVSACEYLLGPRYFVFRKEFRQAAHVERTVADVSTRILVTIGGADEYCATEKVAGALAQFDRINLDVRFLIGAAYSPQTEDAIHSALSGRSIGLKILHRCPSVAAEMLKADIAVIGDGLTKYEAAVTGTPCITLSRPNSDEVMNEEFAQVGSSLHLGDVTKIDQRDLAKQMRDLCEDWTRRNSMVRKGRAMVDGNGITRVLRALQGNKRRSNV